MLLTILCGLIIWFTTSIGAIIVSLFPINKKYLYICLSFSGGIMLSSTIFSLLIPALEFSFIKVVIGLVVGLCIIMYLDKLVDKYSVNKSNNMLFMAMTIHNIPEGILVGLSSVMYANGNITLSSLISLLIGIALQNIPEGSSVALSYRSLGYSKFKSIILGVLSGIVEPIACILTYYLFNIFDSVVVYFLAGSASIMLYVVITELIPQKNDNKTILSFYTGFLFMLCLDFLL